MEYDTAFQAAHIEHMRLLSAQTPPEAFAAVRAVVAEMLEYPGHVTEHGRAMLESLDQLAASPLTSQRA